MNIFNGAGYSGNWESQYPGIPFTFPATLAGSWEGPSEGGGGSIQCIITVIALHEDIDGEGWVNAVQYNILEEVQKNQGYKVELRGVNVRIDVHVEYTLSSSYANETWSKTYFNCMSNVSREDLNYSNIKDDAILRADYGKGEPLIFNLKFDVDLNNMATINYTTYSIQDQCKAYWHPQTFTANEKWTKEQTKIITYDIKKELVSGNGVSNGYIGLADIAKKAQNFYIGIDDKAKKIKAIYIGDKNGKAKKFFSDGGGSIDLPIELFNYKFLSENEVAIYNPLGPEWHQRFPSGKMIFTNYYFPEIIDNKKVTYYNEII